MVGPFAPLAATKVIIFASGLMIYIPPVQTQVSQWTKSSPKALNTFMYVIYLFKNIDLRLIKIKYLLVLRGVTNQDMLFLD